MNPGKRKSAALSYQHRLHSRWEFVRFFNDSEVFRFRECLIFRVPNSLNHFRLGITLKAKGESIARNKVKRAVRESVRTLQPWLGSYDYNVVIPKGKSLDFRYIQRLRETLLRQFRDALARR